MTNQTPPAPRSPHPSIAMLVEDEHTRVRFINPTFVLLFPTLDLHPLLGTAGGAWLNALTPLVNDPALLHWMQQTASNNSPQADPQRWTIILADGRTLWVTALPIQLERGRAAGRAWSFEDVTEQERATQEMAALETTNAVRESVRESETRFRGLMESLEDGYYEADRLGNLTAVNDALCRMVGYTREELLSDPVRQYVQFIVGQDVAAVMTAFTHVFSSGQPYRALETRILRADGSELQIELSITLARNEFGKRQGFRGIVRDITPRKRSEAALNRRMNLLGVLQQVNDDLNQTLDLDIVLSVALNAAMLLADADAGFIGMIEEEQIRLVRSIGYHEPDAPGHAPGGQDARFAAAADPDDTQRGDKFATSLHYMPTARAPLHLSAREGITGRALRSRRGEWVADVRRDPDYRPALADTETLIVLPLFSQDSLMGILRVEANQRERFTQEVFEFATILADRISAAIDNARLYAVAQAQLAEVRDLNTQLAQLEQTKSNMIRVAAHDLKTPLGIMTGYIGVLREDLSAVLTDEQQRFFDIIARALARATRMSGDILHFERLTDSQSEHGTMERVDLRDLIRMAADDHAPQFSLDGVDFQLHLPPRRALYVLCDPVNLGEAIANLLSNAGKYTPAGGRVEIHAGVQAGRVWLEVEDTGYGIPDEMQSRLFQPFYRAKTHDTERIEGTGLGLYLVKKIVEMHGGRIRFRSRLGVGSMFGFDLPEVRDGSAG